MMHKLLLLYNTLRYLKASQLAYFILRRGFSYRNVTSFPDDVHLRNTTSIQSPNMVAGIGVGTSKFKFLNIEKEFIGDVDWSPTDAPRLWRYNLHYFDYLRENTRSDNEKTRLIEQWIQENPQGSQPGWEPFTVSLRIVNWVFFLLMTPRANITNIIVSLYFQALWLEKNDEKHILANHYFENLKALLFAGVFFSGEKADQWMRSASNRLLEQLEEQTLSDGGHYERSPQYHGLMLENYLDIYNLAISNRPFFSPDFSDAFRDTCWRGLQFLQQIMLPDESIPLFNDTAFSISPSLLHLIEYYRRLTNTNETIISSDGIISFADSGFYGYRCDADMVIFSAGNITPHYQPGHTHCDMLSFELMWDYERIVVDSGVFEYEPGTMRSYVRSTRAHNTVSIDGAEQSEIWGEFRIARRANMQKAIISGGSGRVVFSGCHRGFPTLRGSYTHRRDAHLTLDKFGHFSRVDIIDEVVGAGRHLVESFLHLHPGIILSERSSTSLTLTTPNGNVYILEVKQGVNLSIEQAFYCPEFGVKYSNSRIVMSVENNLPAYIIYSITKSNKP